MKIALLNDTHFGARNDSPAFLEYFMRFYNEQFFPYLEKNNIKTLIHLGDVTDRRKFINFKTAHAFRQKFMKRLWEMKVDTHIIIGNHDTYFKNTNEVNSVSELCTTYDGVNEPWIYTNPKEVELGGCRMLFLPWICDDNYEESIYAIDNSTSEICMGHLEIKGFEMQKGIVNEQGLEKSQFKRFEKVISGHFHKKSDNGHIYYLGAQYEQTWSDYKDPKGFHIFDTETRELERISNPLRIHKKFIYNDKDNDYSKVDLSEFNNTFVKVFVTNKTDEDMFNKVLDGLHNNINAHEIMVIEDLNTDLGASVREDILEQGEDTLTFLGNYIDQADTELDKQKLKQHIKEIYVEASER
jgi:DNA repair exonuclease SbcCD nuclease subunit